MKILIINASPVRDGATAEIVKMAAACLQAANEVRAVCIDDYEVKLCRGCRTCHTTARCFQQDDVPRLMAEFAWADAIVTVSPSYWADVPGQFKVFIDRCTPWCNTHEPHASLPSGKQGYSIVLRTGPNMAECRRLIATIEHFYGHLEIRPSGAYGLCSVACKEDAAARAAEITAFCASIMPVVQTPRLTITPATDAQMEEIIENEPDEGMKIAHGQMLSGYRANPAQRQWYAAWLAQLSDGRVVGDLCFKGLSADGTAEIGYGVLPAFQGQGYAAEAVTALTAWAAKQPGVRRIEAETEPDNRASQHVLQKAGFIPTGTMGEEGPRFVYVKT